MPVNDQSISPVSRVPFAKPALTLDEQINLLRSRGLQINDEDSAKTYLKHIGYYRLSGYFLPFQVETSTALIEHEFKQGTEFEDILDAYVFDRKLRILIIDAVERIEVAIRGAVANTLALQYGPHWFLNPDFFNPAHFDHQKFMSDIEECKKQNRSLTFIKHYNNKYDYPPLPPCWMTFEILPFGKVSYIYKNLKSQKHRQEISRQLNVALPNIFESWIHSVSYLRNLCAHHSRVYNKKFTIKPSLTKAQRQVISEDIKLYAQVAVINTLLKTISPESQWIERLRGLFAEHPKIPLKAMGFPEGWEENLFWQ